MFVVVVFAQLQGWLGLLRSHSSSQAGSHQLRLPQEGMEAEANAHTQSLSVLQTSAVVLEN